jgi:hypothetical protein
MITTVAMGTGENAVVMIMEKWSLEQPDRHDHGAGGGDSGR